MTVFRSLSRGLRPTISITPFVIEKRGDLCGFHPQQKLQTSSTTLREALRLTCVANSLSTKSSDKGLRAAATQPRQDRRVPRDRRLNVGVAGAARDLKMRHQPAKKERALLGCHRRRSARNES